MWLPLIYFCDTHQLVLSFKISRFEVDGVRNHVYDQIFYEMYIFCSAQS